MRYAVAAAAIAGAASASWSHGGDNWGPDSGNAGSWGPPTNGSGPAYVTEVVTAFTTFCPEATVITHGSQTWTASASETVTITGPVTITKPIVTGTSAPVTSPVAPVTSSKSGPVGPVGTGSSSKPAVGSASASVSGKPKPSGTAPGTAAGTGSWTTSTSSPIATYATGAATNLKAGIVGILAVVGLVAAL